jgi:hypothetical protein
VHIGLDVQNPIDLNQDKIMRVLQHIAYILVSHEDLITQLHPIHRSGRRPRVTDSDMEDEDDSDPGPDKDDMEIEPCRPYETNHAQAERTTRAAIADYTGYQELKSNARHLARTINPSGKVTWAEMRNKLFQENHRNQSIYRITTRSFYGTTRQRLHCQLGKPKSLPLPRLQV